MKHDLASRLAWAGLFALSGCGLQGGGGTGSDFPIHPLAAQVADADGAPVPATAWRLWSVQDDSLTYAGEAADTLSGFRIPDSGTWVVEAWETASEAGNVAAASRAALPGNLSSCLHQLGRSDGSRRVSTVLLESCADLLSPTGETGASSASPLALSVFRQPDTTQSYAIVQDTASKTLKVRSYRVWKASADSSDWWWSFVPAGYQTALMDGSLELEGLHGVFAIEAWKSTPVDSSYHRPPSFTYLERSLVHECLGASTTVAPKVCSESLFDADLYTNGLAEPAAVIVLRLP